MGVVVQEQTPLPEPPPGAQVQVGSRTLYVRTGGRPDADTAVLVHGLGGSSLDWSAFVPLVDDRVRVLAPDLPGFGRSAPPPDGRYAFASHVDAVSALVTGQPDPVHLVGNSLGGAVAVRVAALHPDRVSTLALVSPALPCWRPTADREWMVPLLLVPGVGSLLNRSMARLSAEQRVAGVVQACFADPSRLDPRLVAVAVAEVERRRELGYDAAALRGSLRGLVRAWTDRGRRALWRQVAGLPMPVLVVTGDRDRLVPPLVARRIARVLPDSRLVVLPGVGHVAHMEVPDLVAREWLGFVGAPAPGADGQAGTPTGSLS